MDDYWGGGGGKGYTGPPLNLLGELGALLSTPMGTSLILQANKCS